MFGCQSSPETSQTNTQETIVQSSSTTQEDVIPTATKEIVLPTSTPSAESYNILFGRASYDILNPKGGGQIISVAFSPDNEYLAMAGYGNISIIKVSQLTIAFTLIGHPNFVSGLDWTPDGKFLLSADIDGNIIFWDTIDFSQKNNLKTGAIVTMDISSDGLRFAIGGEDGVFSIRDVNTGNVIVDFSSPEGSGVHSIKFSPDGSMIASGNKSGVVEIRDAESGELIYATDDLREDNSEVISVDWSFDGSLLASGLNNGIVFIINTSDWTNRQTMDSGISGVSSVNWVPGILALTVTGKGVSNTWNIKTGEDITGTGDYVDYFCADWSSNGRYLAIGTGGSYVIAEGDVLGASGIAINDEPAEGGFVQLWVRVDN